MKPDPANEIRAAFPERDPTDPGHAKLAAALTETTEEREARISAGVAALAAAKTARKAARKTAPSLLGACADALDRLDYLTQDASAEEADGNERVAKKLRAAIVHAARVEAASPGLLEALKSIIDYAEADIEDRRALIDGDDAAQEIAEADSALAAARAAIARAEGGAK